MSEVFAWPRVLSRKHEAAITYTAEQIHREPDAEDILNDHERRRLAYEEAKAQTEVLRLEYERSKAKVRAMMKERAPDV